MKSKERAMRNEVQESLLRVVGKADAVIARSEELLRRSEQESK